MIGSNELRNLMDSISYARLLKDVKKAGVNVSKLKMPERITSQLLSARVRAMVKMIFGRIKIKATKERYGYRWHVWVEEIEKMCRENDYQFYDFFINHPDVKKIDKKYNFNPAPINVFTVFNDRDRGYNDYTLDYNSELLKELRSYREYVGLLLAIYPEIKRQWLEHQKLSIQEKYDAIAKRKAREVERR